MTRRFSFLLIVVLLAFGSLAQPRPPTPAGPLPLDPLTPAEVAAAQQIATKHERVVAVAGPSPRIVTVQFISVKASASGGAEPNGRWADVIVHNDRDLGGARVLVNLSTNSVAEIVKLTERNVPIGQGDVETAASLAVENAAVQRLLGGADVARTFRAGNGPTPREALNQNRIQGVSDRGVDPDDPCTTHRCVALFFRTRGGYVATNQVTVDLTLRRVYVRGEGGRP